MNYSLPALIACLIVVVVVAITYTAGSGLGAFVHFLAFLELLVGIGYILWNYNVL